MHVHIAVLNTGNVHLLHSDSLAPVIGGVTHVASKEISNQSTERKLKLISFYQDQ
jgi:hypothetical protein